MDEKSGPRILDTVIRIAGFLLIGIALVTFFYLLSSTISNYRIISEIPTSEYLLFNFSLSRSLFLLIIVGISVALIIGLSTFVFKFNQFSKGFTGSGDKGYFRFLALYVLAQLIFSAFVEYFIPSIGKEFPYNMSFADQNFFISSSVVFSTFLFDFIPILVAISVYLLAVGKFNTRNLFNYQLKNNNVVFMAVILAIIVTVIEGGPIVILVSDLFITLVLNVIILKFGFFKGFLSYFSISLAGIAEGAIASYSPVLSIVIYIIMLIIGFLGIYVLFSMGMSAPKEDKKPLSEDASTVNDKPAARGNPERSGKSPKIELFVRSQCPNCGNTSFHVVGNMTLKCSKCEYEMEKDATGIPNITLEFRRNFGI